MEYIYTDASYSNKSGIGGFAVAAPKWCSEHKGRWFSRWHIETFREKSHVIYCSACRCSDSSDAEKRALGLAFLVACDMLSARENIKIEIISDSLEVLSSIIKDDNQDDQIISALSRLRKNNSIIISKVKAHNGHAGNELADKWAKRARHKFKEENNTMRMPFRSNNQNGNSNNYNRRSSSPNPFDGATEMDIRTLTERVLNDENNIGYVTPEGKVMPRNMAFSAGNRNGIELVKQRIWGFDDEILTDDEDKEIFDEENSNDNNIDDPSEDFYPVRVVYSDEALQTIADEAAKSPDIETGGALIGSWQRDPDGYITINAERATGPGSEAVRNTGLFSPHLEYYRSRVAYYRKYHNWDYLGEWHKHPGDFDSLSSTDIDTAYSLIDEEGWPLLMLPIVNKIGGRLVMENNLILSPQLGGEIMTHIDTVELENFPQSEDVKAYFDVDDIKKFRASEKDIEILDGIYNSGESYIFLNVPGVKNAAAKLIRDNASKFPVSGLDNVITAVVSDDDIRCYHSREGEIAPVEHIIIDTKNTIYERNSGLTETSVLRDKSVTLIGCGSLGSTISASLARAGVGNFCLFDPDRLSPVNIARHQAGIRDLGRSKVNVVRDIIHGINPAINVETFAFDIVNTEEGYNAFDNAAMKSDIIICTTDTDDSRMLVNDFAVKNKIKAVQAGLHERAASGIVHVYNPESDEACFACQRNNILSESSKRNENIAYSEANDVRDLTIQPGLSAQINTVAEIAALRSIDALMERHSLPSLTLVFIDRNQDDERALALSIRHLEMARVDSCSVCGQSQEDYDNEQLAGGNI